VKCRVRSVNCEEWRVRFGDIEWRTCSVECEVCFLVVSDLLQTVLSKSSAVQKACKKGCLCKVCSTKACWEVPCASPAVQSSTGRCREVLCASFAVQSSPGRYFVEALRYWEILLAGFVIQSSAGMYFVQAM